MPQLIITPLAREDIKRCMQFLQQVSENKAMVKCALNTLLNRLTALESFPEMGAVFDTETTYRQLIIPFGKNAYHALYRYNLSANTVEVLSIKHSRENSYTLLPNTNH